MSLKDIASLGKVLAQFFALFADCFHGVNGRRLFAAYVRGLLSELQRKNVEAIALRQGCPAKNAPAIPRVHQVGPRLSAPAMPQDDRQRTVRPARHRIDRRHRHGQSGQGTQRDRRTIRMSGVLGIKSGVSMNRVILRKPGSYRVRVWRKREPTKADRRQLRFSRIECVDDPASVSSFGRHGGPARALAGTESHDRRESNTGLQQPNRDDQPRYAQPNRRIKPKHFWLFRLVIGRKLQ